MVGKKKPGSQELNGRGWPGSCTVIMEGSNHWRFLNVMLFTENSSNSKNEYNMVQATAQVPEGEKQGYGKIPNVICNRENPHLVP